MKRSLRTHLLSLYVLLAVVSGIVIPIFSVWLSVNGFHEYQVQRRQANFDALADALANLYAEDGAWNRRRIMDILRPAPQWLGMTIKLNDVKGKNIFTLTPITSFSRAKGRGNTPQKTGESEYFNINLTLDKNIIGFLNIERRMPQTSFEQAFAMYMIKRTVIGGVIMIIAACGLGFIVAGGLSRPVIRALERTRQISRGEYDLKNLKIKNTGILEMDDLTRGVEDLSRSLAAQEKFRQRLMTDIAHELRTPLTASMTQIEAMADGIFDATPERLELCLSEMERLGNLIKSVESLTRLEGDSLMIKLERVNMAEFLSAALNSFEPLFKRNNIKLNVKLDNNITADIDQDKFRHAIDNLLSNALRYTPSGGSVEVRLYLYTEDPDEIKNNKNKKIIIEVEDTGTGIAEADLLHIFDRFYRTDESRAKFTGGRGVGLAIARAAVEAHGGKISASSEYGKGSCFKIIL